MKFNVHDIHFKNYLNPDYWFSVDRITLHLSDWMLFSTGLVLIAAASIIKLFVLYSKHPVTKRLLNRLFNVFLWTGLIEAVWFALRYENARVIGTHVVAVLILLIGALCVVPILKFWIKKYKAEHDAWDKEQLKLKYLQK